MKNNIIKIFVGAACILSATSCSIDEVYKSQLDQDVVYSTKEGYNGIINSCYDGLYYIYGKLDGLYMQEIGTDLWQNGGTNSSGKELANYVDMNTNIGQNQVVWNALYSTVAYCNTAIYYKDKCKGYEADSTGESLNAKAAEAYFLRGFSNFWIVENWGNATLNNESMASAGARESATRNTEEEFYDQIISDLNFAYEYLPETQGTEKGRANKDAAAAMLAKAWMQRSRLVRDAADPSYPSVIGTPKYSEKQCADSAFYYAKKVIESSTHSLYQSTATKSGSNIEWDDSNNKNNKEFLFIEYIDESGYKNPETTNRGRTASYYAMRIGQYGENFGLNTLNCRYTRDVDRTFKPTYYMLTKIFDPRPQQGQFDGTFDASKQSNRATAATSTPDTRFDDTFYWKYFCSYPSYKISKENWINFKKDPALATGRAATKNLTITGNVATPTDARAKAINYYCGNGFSGDYVEFTDNDDALSVFTPNWALDSAWCANQKFLCAGMPDLTGSVNTSYFCYFSTKGTGANADSTQFRALQPTLRKWLPFRYVYTMQSCMSDIAIIRLTDIYLIAAEAALKCDKKSEGLTYLNDVRKHAAITSRQSEMVVSDYDEDFICDERARELCGEQWRWIDLKRLGKLNFTYLSDKNIWLQSMAPKNVIRPIPQEFLNQISNPGEYGTNGY